MSYLGAAESLVRTHALRIPAADWDDADSTAPLHHFPPGFPIAIALPMTTGLPATGAARLVMAAGAGGTAAGLAWLAELAGGTAAALLAPVLFALLPATLDLHLQVLSEPLFLALLVLTLALMVVRPERPWAYGTAAALGAMVRYAGLSLAGAAAAWAWLGRPRWYEGAAPAPRARESGASPLRRAAAAAAPSAVLFAAWAARVALTRTSIRQVAYYAGALAGVHSLGAAVADQLAPSVGSPALRGVIAAAALALLALLLARGSRRARRSGDAARRLFAAAGLVALAYTALLLAARAFADPGIPFDSRLLSPLFLLAALLAAVSLGLCWPHLGAAGRAAAVAALLLWGAGAAGVFRDELADARANGTGYASRAWRTAPISRWLRGPARDYALFTNHPMIAYIQAGRASRELPDTLTPDVLADFRDVLRARHGAVVGFRDSYRPMVSPDTLAAKLGLVPLLRSAEGTVWAPPGGN